ncbi:pro-epidermal growth factor-like [Stylophora pistillata]|uniref:pro-epidermal growth factor-like n=1 Tax=Stylophora pistillata TaxID=50429 RepID=UPI000C0450B7|nr:pro-epidermal growth factor-like [Stylophora pistillata]
MLNAVVSSEDLDNCRSLEFKPTKAFDGQRLINHVVRIDEVKDKILCEIRCFLEPNCVSYNFERKRSGNNGTSKCELNNVTHEGNEDELVGDFDYLYYGAESTCIRNLCKNNATCQSGFTDKGYRCWCTAGFKGQTCDEDINECVTEEQRCSVDAVCSNTKGSYNCSCKPGFLGNGSSCTDIDECAIGTHDCNTDAVCINTKGSFNCTCKRGNSGDGRTCKDIDECTTGEHNCSPDSVCSNVKGSYKCQCEPGYSGDGWTCEATISSCKEAFDRQKLSVSGVVVLHFDLMPTSVFCHVEIDGCGRGAWTPVMKIDGNKRTFHHSSNFWINNTEYNPLGGETGFDQVETKLPSYWHTSFSKICLGMEINEQLRFIVINMQADSLYSLIADGQYRNTSLGRDMWKSLIGPQASSQIYCNKEGFNVYSEQPYWTDRAAKARIGFVTNNADNCGDVDTRIGFGTGGPHDDTNTCGIVANKTGLDNGPKFIKAMGYILVQ